jgi:hypothetical protein
VLKLKVVLALRCNLHADKGFAKDTIRRMAYACLERSNVTGTVTNNSSVGTAGM